MKKKNKGPLIIKSNSFGIVRKRCGYNPIRLYNGFIRTPIIVCTTISLTFVSIIQSINHIHIINNKMEAAFQLRNNSVDFIVYCS